nr:peroxidase-related enzyme [Mycobacterium shinjukuense]
MRLVTGRDVPDIIKVRYYRPRFFGKPFFQLAQAVLRGPSPWTIGERELFAAFVSACNRCQFCATTHQAVASSVLDPALTVAVVTDWRTADVDDKVKATLGLLEKLTRRPDEVGPADMRAVLDAGVSPDAIRDAIEVCALFNTINRVADGLDFALPTAADRAFSTRVLLKLGYR